MENTQPVQNSQDAGTEPKVEPVVTPVEDQTTQMDTQKVIDLLEESDKALTAAETKIVSLKRKSKTKKTEQEYSDEPEENLDDKINRLLEERLASQRQEFEDIELQRIVETKKKMTEFRAALLAKRTVSNSSMGSNQSVAKPENDPLKNFSEKDLEIISYRAKQLGMDPKEYARKKFKN